MNFAGQRPYGRALWLALVLLAAGCVVWAQQAASNRVIGTVSAVNGNSITVKTDAGATQTVTIADSARILRTAPGQKTLAGAEKITAGDIAAGDRVLMAVSGEPPTASTVIINKAGDIAAMQQKEQADWQHRGVGGLVKSVDASAGTVTITQGARTITIHTSPSTTFRRYAPDSVKFTDAKPSTLAAIQPGDQVQAKGDKNADGTEVTADAVVSGSFRNIAGTVESTDPSAGTFTVKDLVTKQSVTVKTTPDSDMRRLEPQMAQMIAMRLRGNGGGAGMGRAQGAASAGNASTGGNAPGRQGGGGGFHPGTPGAGAGGPGGGGGGAGALARVLQRSPEIKVADLHKGDAVMIVATSGSPDTATAIRLVSGVEPMLQASASGSESMFSSAWNLGGGSGGGDDQGGGDTNP
ncbi:MAG TPA: DUF5666 domain-containing protein [Acidobacteriaceae bacterium]|nr:DUF5666 domain-containing protein [Acidobacteriaceae bacterium]